MLSRLLKFLDIQGAPEVTLVLILVSFHIPRLFYSQPVSSTFYSLLLFKKYFLHFPLVYLDW